MLIRNVTAGPITASIEAFDYPMTGIACPTFAGGLKDDHFTFSHSLVPKKNYVIVNAGIVTEHLDVKKASSDAASGESVVRSANISTTFVTADQDPASFNRQHPLETASRFPDWWCTYLPLGRFVFWDDSIVLMSETDDDMLALKQYIKTDRGLGGVMELLYEKYQFAETARMEELRSRHLQRLDLKENLVATLNEVWRALPDSRRQQLAYFLDPYITDILFGHIAPGLFDSSKPIELEQFCQLIRDFILGAAMLHLTKQTHQRHEREARQREREEQRRRAEQQAIDEAQRAKDAADEAARLADLLKSNPEEYARLKKEKEDAIQQEKDARRQEKIERKKAERLQELEEEAAIAKEQKRLDKLAERDPDEYERRQHALQSRIRRLEEKKQQRAAQKAQKAARDAEKSGGGGETVS
ncbi:hypothetical protein PINS_up013760 [Pythium insidiosum]|nr:hypothetical protein PINS_up013760 [Pythium insidiosum]